MRIDLFFIVSALLFLGDIFGYNGYRLSQVGIFFLAILIIGRNSYLSKRALRLLGLLVVYNFCLNILSLVKLPNSTFKLLITFFILLSAFYVNGSTYRRLLSYYLMFSSFVVAIWWIQLVTYILSMLSSINLEFIYDSSYWSGSGILHKVGVLPRLNSLYSEPSYLGLFLLPLFSYYFRGKVTLKTTLILVPIIMTLSLNVYVGLGVAFLLFFKLNYKMFLFFSFFLLVVSLLGLDEYVLHRISVDSDHIDLTLLIYILHVQGFLSIWTSLIFGYGVDNYALLFDGWRSNFEVSDIVTIAQTIPDEDLMLRSGPLLIIRMFVELGYAFVLLLLLIFRRYIFVKTIWLYAIIGLSLRDGDYLRPFFLFFLIMHFSYSVILHSETQEEVKVARM